MKSEKKIHLWQHCHHCNASPVIGVRYECQSCPAGPDIDLCSSCFELYEKGVVKHPVEHSHISIAGIHRFLPREGTPPDPCKLWLEIPMAESPTPRYKQGFLVRPEFCFGHESAFGGYSFVVNSSRGRVMLTALHVLDEVIKKNNIDASGTNSQYTGLELSRIIDRVNLYDVLEEKWMFHDLGTCKKMVVLPNARVGDEEPVSYRDISAFWIDIGARVQAANLAKKSPEIGEPVWLAAKSSDNTLSRKAVVVEKNQHSFIFRYASNEGLPKYCSGAPLLDRDGNVVAINVGSGKFENRRFGHANHVESIHKHLAIN